eukprot:5871585-Ditylum_brightwellii.AAC.1
MRFFSKKKGRDTQENSPNAYIMSLFKDKDVKKAIRAFVLSAEVIEIGSPAKDAVKQALNVPYVALKRQPNKKTSGAQRQQASNMSLGQYGHQSGTNSNWGQAADKNSIAKEVTIQSVDSDMSRSELD